MNSSVMPKNMKIEDLERLFRSLFLIRRTEERIAEIYPGDSIKSPVHLSIGQEAVAVGVCDVLRPDDIVAGSYRGHAAYLAKGGSLDAMMAELYGKADGCAAGKGGSMHLIDMDHNVLGSSAVVGTHIPVAVGFALKARRDGKDNVVTCFFGDGATEEGVFYECLNFASLHKLPILFVCENNFLAIHTPLEKRWASTDLGKRVEGFGIPYQKTEAPDIFKVRALTDTAVAQIRQGGGPQFLECHTYRWREHVGPNDDIDADYRSREAFDAWCKEDQVARLEAMLPADRGAALKQAVEDDIAASIRFAEDSPFPDSKELTTHVFAD